MRAVILVCAATLAATTARATEYTTKNFHVTAPTKSEAESIGRKAEYYRKRLAKRWLGKVLPDWDKPCPVNFKPSFAGQGGATSFAFDRGRVLWRRMELQGRLDEVLRGTLPHEVSHTILADHFNSPVPRWVDEGAAVRAELSKERGRYRALCRDAAKTGRLIPLGRLFALAVYPPDVNAFYGQSVTVTEYLLGLKDRRTLLAFAKEGNKNGWEKAVKKHYGVASVAELEKQWLRAVRTKAKKATSKIRAER